MPGAPDTQKPLLLENMENLKQDDLEKIVDAVRSLSISLISEREGGQAFIEQTYQELFRKALGSRTFCENLLSMSGAKRGRF